MSQNDRSPLLAEFRPDRFISVAANQKITQAVFINTVRQLAQRLPDNTYFINLCQHRYHFLLVFCAVITRGGINILPPNRHQVTIQQIREDYPQALCIHDDNTAPGISDIALMPLLAEISRQHAWIDVDKSQIPLVINSQIVAIAYTSGSTGKPRPNKKTWQILNGTARLLCQRFLADMPNGAINAGDTAHATVLIPTVPAQHMYGLETSIMMVLQGESTLYSGDTFYPENIAAAFRAVHRGILITTPIHLLALEKSAVPIAGIDKIICATAPLKQQLCTAIEHRYHTVIEEIYGFTEAGSVATRKTGLTENWLLLDEMVITRNQSDLLVNGPQFSSAVPILDVVELMADGKQFRLVGRSEDLLNVAGKRASLADLNFKLTHIDGVNDGLFFMPEETKEVTRPLAIVVSGLPKREILQQLSVLIDPVFMPRPLIYVDHIPRNETGKPQKHALMEIVEAYERKQS